MRAWLIAVLYRNRAGLSPCSGRLRSVGPGGRTPPYGRWPCTAGLGSRSRAGAVASPRLPSLVTFAAGLAVPWPSSQPEARPASLTLGGSASGLAARSAGRVRPLKPTRRRDVCLGLDANESGEPNPDASSRGQMTIMGSGVGWQWRAEFIGYRLSPIARAIRSCPQLERKRRAVMEADDPHDGHGRRVIRSDAAWGKDPCSETLHRRQPAPRVPGGRSSGVPAWLVSDWVGVACARAAAAIAGASGAVAAKTCRMSAGADAAFGDCAAGGEPADIRSTKPARVKTQMPFNGSSPCTAQGYVHVDGVGCVPHAPTFERRRERPQRQTAGVLTGTCGGSAAGSGVAPA